MQNAEDISNKTPREILNKFYAEHNLDTDGGQSKYYVKIEVASHFHFYFPNFNARRKAVIKHDIHHLLTGYATDLAGESEISAWEVASGCKEYWAAFLIDLSGFMLGFLFNFPHLLKSFARGRRTSNLYHDRYTTDQALDMKIGELRKEFKLDEYPKYTTPTFADFFLFSIAAFFGGIYSILSWLLLPVVLIFSLYVEIRLKLSPKPAA